MTSLGGATWKAGSVSRRAGLIAGLGLGLALLSLLGYRVAVEQQRARNELPVLFDAPAFVLTDQLGRPVDSSELTGKVVVANFIYTGCRDVCPLLSAQMQALQQRLSANGLLGDVQLLSFTVDPARDTPAILRQYADCYGADADHWRFLTGPEDVQVPLIVDGFHLGVQALPPDATQVGAHEGADGVVGHPQVMHSGRFVVIDRRWRIRAYYEGRDLDQERLIRAVQALNR